VGPIKQLIGVVDRWQRRHPVPGVTYGVLKKFGDDQANLLVVGLGWYGFTSIYPLLLVLVTVFGFIGVGSLGHGVVSTLHQFPVIGQQFTPGSGSSQLHGSVPGLIIGVLGLLYGAQGVTQTGQQALARVWNVPRLERPGFLPRLGRSFAALVCIAVAFLVTAALSGVVTSSGSSWVIRVPVLVGLLLVNTAAYGGSFRALTPAVVPTRSLWIGAVAGAVGFTALTTVGTGLVQHQVKHMQATYGSLAATLGVVTYLLLLAKVSMYAAELNTVVARRLYPRSLPTTEPTEVDDQVLHDLAHEQREREDQRVGTGFGGHPAEEAKIDASRDDDQAPQPELDDAEHR
jgi:uncharacterized BrkB/YihY/UPF0761 family membrane protein